MTHGLNPPQQEAVNTLKGPDMGGTTFKSIHWGRAG